MSTVARQNRKGSSVGGGWSRVGLVGEWSFESSDGTDTSPPAANNLTLSNTAIVAGINGLALDTQTIGYGSKTGITADLKTTAGTLHRYFKRTDLSKNTYLSFSQSGGVGDEIYFAVLSSASSFPNGLQVAVIDGGVVKIQYRKASVITDTAYHLVSMAATGSEYLMYVDGALVAGFSMDIDVPAYRGLWTGATELSGIDSFTVGGINRAGVVGNEGETVDELVKVYDYAQTATEIADLYAIIGGEK